MTAMHWARTASMLLRQPLMAGIISGNTTTDMSGRGIGSPSSKGWLIRRINGPARRSTAPAGPIGTQNSIYCPDFTLGWLGPKDTSARRYHQTSEAPLAPEDHRFA